jgi:hypothetical protein
MSKLMLACWSCSGIYGNYFYARNLLYNDELSFLNGLDDQFCYYASSSRLNDNTRRWKRGQGDVTLLWRRNIIIKKLFMSDVCLPSNNSNTIKFQNELRRLGIIAFERARG